MTRAEAIAGACGPYLTDLGEQDGLTPAQIADRAREAGSTYSKTEIEACAAAILAEQASKQEGGDRAA